MIKNIYLEQDGFRIEITVQPKSVATYGEMQYLNQLQEQRFVSDVKQALSDLMTALADNEQNRKNITKENRDEKVSSVIYRTDDGIPF